MTSWGVLMGLGQGLQRVGGMLMDKQKSQFADKLEQDREVRAEQRQLGREQRAQVREDTERATRVAKTRYTQKDGAWFEQNLNADNKVIDEQLAPKTEIDRLNREEQKEQTSLDSLLTKQKLDEKKLASYDADQALERRLTEAQIGNYEASAGASRARGADLEDKMVGGNIEDAVDQLVEDNNALFKQYAADEEFPLAASDFRNIAKQSVKAAAERGLDARSFFIDALERYMKNPNNMPRRRAGLESKVK